MNDKNKEVLVQVNNLKKHFPIMKGVFRRQVGAIKAVDGVSFNIYKGETLGLVGESGCGKSTTGRVVLRLYQPTEGTIVFENTDITKLEGNELRSMRPRMQMIFQDPHACLNPRMTVGSIVSEPLDEHGVIKGQAKKKRVEELLSLVGLNPAYANRYPHEFSGGQRQRVAIARALVLKPAFIVLDEPTSSLDVSIQAQILDLLRQLQRDHDLAYLFISHDLKVVRAMANYIVVMHHGKVVEEGPTEVIFERPRQTYTQALMAASLTLEAVSDAALTDDEAPQQKR